jgi:hypothetical protein
MYAEYQGRHSSRGAKCPHPKHWVELAELVGFNGQKSLYTNGHYWNLLSWHADLVGTFRSPSLAVPPLFVSMFQHLRPVLPLWTVGQLLLARFSGRPGRVLVLRYQNVAMLREN